jgi:hypothetical protein
LEENLQTLQIATEAGFQKFASSVQKFTSFMDLTTDSLQNLGATLSRQVAHAHKNQRLTNAAITFLLNLILSQSEYVDASSQILQFETQLRQLIAGQLPRNLITPEMLEDVTKNISAFLQKYDVPLHLPDRPIFDLYKNPNFVLSRRDNKIIVSLKFPLSLTRSSLTLYKVTALRLPTDAQNLHVSFIQNLPSFIAYEETQPWYLELHHYPILDNGIYYIERHSSVLKHKSSPTCIIALLEGGTESIQKLCKFVIQPYAAKEEILILGPGQLLLQFVKQYTLTCQNITQTYNACTNCVLSIPLHVPFQIRHSSIFFQDRALRQRHSYRTKNAVCSERELLT